jgi:hypothetical protein
MVERNQRDKEKIKSIIAADKQALVTQSQQEREKMKQEFQKLLKLREEAKAKIQTKNDKERALFDILRQEKPNYEVRLIFCQFNFPGNR